MKSGHQPSNLKARRSYTSWWAYSPDECGEHASIQKKVEFLRPYLTPRSRPLTPRPEPSGNVICIPPTVAARQLSEFEMSPRLRSALVLNNYWRLGDLDGVAYDDLLQLRNCGKVSVAELKQLLKDLQ